MLEKKADAEENEECGYKKDKDVRMLRRKKGERQIRRNVCWEKKIVKRRGVNGRRRKRRERGC